MKLYELSGLFDDLFDSFEDIDNYTPEDGEEIPDIDAFRERMREGWFDTLSAIEAEFDVKAENIACYIKNMNAEIKALKAEEDALKRRRKAFENSVERLKGYLLGSMNAIGRRKIDTPQRREPCGGRRTAVHPLGGEVRRQSAEIRGARDPQDRREKAPAVGRRAAVRPPHADGISDY